MEMSTKLTDLYLEGDVEQWKQHLDADYIPKSYVSVFGCLATTFAALVLPSWLVSWLITELAGVVMKENQSNFMINEYLPAILDSMKDINVEFWDWIVVTRLFTGFIMK